MSEYNLLNSPKDCDFLALDQNGLLFEKQHAYPGKFRMKTGKGPVDFELTAESLRAIASESNRYIANGNKCNLPVEHTEDPEKNRGHNTKWYVKKDSKGRDGLFSLTEFRDAEAVKLAKTAQTSLFVPPTYEDGKKEKYVRPVRHVALTDYPVIPGLDGFTPLAASLVTSDITNDKEEKMPIKDLAAGIGLQLSEAVLSDEVQASKAIVDEFKAVELQLSDSQKELEDYKKLNPPKADPVRISKAQVAMLRENRELKLSSLVEQGKILTCVKKHLEEIFCDDASLTLSLSEDKEDNFNAVIEALKDNDPIKLSEATGPQAKDVSSLLNAETNPVIADAKRKAERAKARA